MGSGSSRRQREQAHERQRDLVAIVPRSASRAAGAIVPHPDIAARVLENRLAFDAHLPPEQRELLQQRHAEVLAGVRNQNQDVIQSGAGEVDGDVVPGPFMCPITLERMVNPVVALDGHSYSHAAIQHWFTNKLTSPCTNEALESDLLVPNHALRKAIENSIDGRPIPLLPDRLEVSEELLGEGSFGRVLAGRLRNGHRTELRVAVKTLPAMTREQERQTFREELKKMKIASLHCDNVCVVYGACVMQHGPMLGRVCLVMKRYEHSLDFVIEATGGAGLDEESALRYIEILGRALNQLHEIGLVLRDIKPPNILLDAYDQPVFADFGIAMIVSTIAHSPGTSILGTFNYMAPEAFEPQAFAKGIGPHTDVWALACVMVEMLTGQKPWMGMQMQQISRAVCDQHATPTVPEDAPAADVLRQCFARLPEQRPTTAEFAQSFASVRQARFGAGEQGFMRRLADQEAITEEITNMNSELTQEIERLKMEKENIEQEHHRLQFSATELALENSRLLQENLILKSQQDQAQENSHEVKSIEQVPMEQVTAMMDAEFKKKKELEQKLQRQSADLVSAQQQAEAWKQRYRKKESELLVMGAIVKEMGKVVKEMNEELQASAGAQQHEGLLQAQPGECAGGADVNLTTEPPSVSLSSSRVPPMPSADNKAAAAGALRVETQADSPTTAAGGLNSTPQTSDAKGAGEELQKQNAELNRAASSSSSSCGSSSPSAQAIQQQQQQQQQHQQQNGFFVLPIAARRCDGRSGEHGRTPDLGPSGLSSEERVSLEENVKISADAARLPLHLEHPDTFVRELPSLQSKTNWLVLVEGVKFHIKRPAVATAGLGAILTLLWGPANHRKNSGPAFHAGVLSATFAAMRMHGNELAVIQTACYVLWSINADSPEEELIRRETGAGGGMQLLFAALDAFGTVDKVANAATVALVNVMTNDPTNQLSFIQLGGVERMLDMVKHEDHLIQKKAIRALLNLVQHERAALRKIAQDRLTALNVETPVQSAMNRHAATSDTKEWGQKLLSHLANVPRGEKPGTPELWEREISKNSAAESQMTRSASNVSTSSDGADS